MSRLELSEYEAGNSRASRVVGRLTTLPADIVLGVLFTAIASGTVLLTNGTPLRAALALPLVLFLPGYAVVSVVFPGRGRGLGGSARERIPGVRESGEAPRTGERAALAFGTSLALLPPLALAVTAFGLPFDEVTVIGSLNAVTLGGLLLATGRRWQLPADERFDVPIGRWLEDGFRAVFETDTRLDAAMNLGIGLAAIVALSTLGYAIAVPHAGASYTEFAAFTENQSGELVSAGYPTDFSRGEQRQLILSVENHEGSVVDYAIVAELQRFDGTSDAVTERRELGRFSMTVGDGATQRRPVAIAPPMVGEDLRLVFYLYEGDAPRNPSQATATEHLHLWIDVAPN